MYEEHKETRASKRTNLNHKSADVVPTLIVPIKYLLFLECTCNLVEVAIDLANSDKFVEALTTYLKCELSGHVPDKCDRSEFEQCNHPM